MSKRTDIDIAAMKARLLEMKAELEVLANEHEHDSDVVELDQATQGRLSRMDALQGQAMAQEVARRREAEIRRIDAALKRIEDGDYGRCVSCAEQIQPKRLDFDPSVPNCIKCARGGET
ncbi:MAG: TraR/DksA family transcriptional regulator [Alphaproteobacteria bacterium]|nr:TraR/DksA family transcriptional regulator [Alphaproteobacteria bacterium]MCK5623510.1 TraR/DksA family transcriptional regulator [Alphaproteobacteria bacterium]